MSTDAMTDRREFEMQGENLRRRQQVRELKAKLAEAEKGLADRDARLAALAKDVEAATAEAERARATPGEKAQELEALRKELWKRDHKDAFRRLAAEARVRPEATDDLWSLLGIDPAGPDVDEAGYREKIAESVKARSYLIAAEAVPGTGARGGAQGGLLGGVPSAPGPGAGRPSPEPSPSSDPRTRQIEAARARFGGGDNPFRLA